MKITPLSINRFRNVSSLNKHMNRNNNIYNAQSVDTVSFSGGNLGGTEEIINIQTSYQTPIAQLRAIKRGIKTSIEGAFTKEVDYNSSFEENYKYIFAQRRKYLNATEELKKEPLYKARDIVEKFWGEVVYPASDIEARYMVPNAVTVVSDDKKLANKFIDTMLYHAKEKSTLPFTPNGDRFDEYMRMAGDLSMVDFEKIPDKYSKVEDLQEAIFDSLEKAKQKFADSKITTILHVENIEPAISKNNHPQNLACMRDMLSSAWDDFRTVLVFGVSDKAEYDTGSVLSHRVGKTFNLDANGITESEVKKLSVMRSSMESSVDRIKSVVREKTPLYRENVSDIKDWQEQCRLDVQAVKEKYPKPRLKKVKAKVDVVENTLSKNKKLAIAFGAIAAVGVGAGLLYNKYIKNKAEKTVAKSQTQQAQPIQQSAVQQPVQVVTAPKPKTTNLLQQRLQVNA